MEGDRHVPTSSDFSLALGWAVARHLRADERAVRARADRNLNRARAQYDVEPPWIRQWQQLLDGPVEALIGVLTSPDEYARVLRQSSPFAGVLAPRERWAILAEVKAARRETATNSVATNAARALRQAEMGVQLAEPLSDGEQSWLDAGSGNPPTDGGASDRAVADW